MNKYTPDDFDWRTQFVGYVKDTDKIAFVSLERRLSADTTLSAPLPSPSAIILGTAIDHSKRAISLYGQLGIQKGENSFSDPARHKLLFDYIENYFAAVALSVTAVESFCNSHIDSDLRYTPRSKTAAQSGPVWWHALVNFFRPLKSEELIGEAIERKVPLEEKLRFVVAPRMGVTIDAGSSTEGVVRTNKADLVRLRDIGYQAASPFHSAKATARLNLNVCRL